MHATAAPKLKRARRQAAQAPAKRTGAMTLRLPFTDPADVLRFRPAGRFSDEQFFQFCRANNDLRIEQTAGGTLMIMPPVRWEGGARNFRLYTPFDLWQERVGGGKCADSSTGYTLPNGAKRSPDFSWVRQERLDRLTPEQREEFLPLCPDFVLELRSKSDRLPALQRKMDEYMANGARLGWLINPPKKQVFIYRPGEPVEHLDNPATLSGEPVLAGFTLDLARVW